LLVGATAGVTVASVNDTRSPNSDFTTASVGFSNEPQLVTDGVFEIPPSVLKKGIAGTVIAEIEIGRNGLVEKSSIRQPGNPLLDSIALASIARFVYAPAVENGRTVPSAIRLQIEFNADSIIARSESAPPELDGLVLDKESKTPLAGAAVYLSFTDTTADPDVTVGFNRYLDLIGKLPGQTCYHGVLSTVTDSAGRFAFRLLPSCPALLSVQARGKELTHFTEQPKTGHRATVSYLLTNTTGPAGIDDSANTITVYGRPVTNNGRIDVERQQVASGLTHYLSKLLVAQSAIRQVPESGSALLVRAAGPFDNVYLIAGVPFLAPFHFGGTELAYADIDGMMISALSDITVSVDRIAGRRIDADGALIEANPGIYRPANPKLVKRPELALDYSTIGQDFLLSIPNSKTNDDFLQLGVTRGDDYSLKWLYSFWNIDGDAAIGIGRPLDYANCTLTGKQTVGSLQCNAFAWLALDWYASGGYVPWGMASVRINPAGHTGESLLAGGSHQYFTTGKRIGDNVYLNRCDLSNAVIGASLDSALRGPLAMDLDCRIEYLDWCGSVTQRNPAGNPKNYYERGKEADGSLHAYLRKGIGRVEAAADILLTGISYGATFDAVADGGASLLLDLQPLQAGLHCGRITSRPDVRGLPDSAFRRRQLHSYVASLPIYFTSGMFVRFGAQPYLRYQDRCPRANPILYRWDTSATTPLQARGVDFDCSMQPLWWLSLHGALNLSQAWRTSAAGVDSSYEWNVPWSARMGMHCTFFRQRFHCYIDYILSKGVPYYNFNAMKYLTLPDYKRFDVSLQYRTPMKPHRFLTRYDAYFEAHNLFDRLNIRDYYWTPAMQRRALVLAPFDLEVGLRCGFRL
jgi:TonB family protein